MKSKSVIFAISWSWGHNVLGLISSAKIISGFLLHTENVFELIYDLTSVIIF